MFGDLMSVSNADDIIATSYDDKGRIVEKSNGLGSITYQYDVMDRVIDMVEVINGASFHFSYGYDAAGGLLYVDYPDSGRVSYIYDDLGRLTNVVSNGQQLLHLTYNLDGSVATETYGGGNSIVSYAYNERGWVRGIFDEDRYGTDLLGLRYTYDAAGNVVSIEDDIGQAGTENYWYDALGRLKKATGAWGAIQYGYDAVGNRLWKNENGNNVSYSYEAYNQLSYDGTWGYEHDDDGNIVWKEASNLKYNYVYDALGRMTSVVKHELLGNWVATTLGEYSYDANGARVMMVDPSGTSRFVYSGHDPVYEVSSDGSTNKYIYANGRLAIRIVDGTENDCYISDALGSTRLVLKNGNAGPQDVKFSAVTYKPFGAVYSSSGSDPVTFAGEMVDDTGLVYLFARYYDPELGRFYALDPILGDVSSPQTMNGYAYCHNNPIAYKDPTGKFGIFGALIGGAIGATANVLISAATGNLHSWEDVSKAAVVGGVSGAIAGATCGLGLALGVIGGSAAGIVGEFTDQLLEGRGLNNLNVNSIIISGAMGAAFGGLGELAPALKAGSAKQMVDNMKKIKIVDMKPIFKYGKSGPIRERGLPYMDLFGALEYQAGGNRAKVQFAIDTGLSLAESGANWVMKRTQSSVSSNVMAVNQHAVGTMEVRTFSIGTGG